MTDRTLLVGDPASIEVVPPPRRRAKNQVLHLHAVQVIRILGLLPLAVSIVAFAAISHRRLPSPTRRRGHPIVYSDASIVLLAMLGRLWQLSSREVCLWVATWPLLAATCGLPTGRVIDPGHFIRRIKRLGAYPFWLLYLALVWRGLRSGLLTGRDVVIDSSLLGAWSSGDPDADWSFPSSFHGYVFGYKVHVLLDRAARLPLFFLLSPANRNDLPFAYPLLWFGRCVLALPIHVVRADGAYWGKELVSFIVTVIGAHPIIPFNRKKQPLARVRHLVYWPLSYLARAIIERFFAAAKRYYGLDTSYRLGWDAVLLQVTLTFCAILVVGLLAAELGRPDLRLSPTRVLAHYLPVGQAA
jgi:Transposase DDE domain